MTTEDLRNYIIENVPTFQNLRIIENGLAYHYTTHLDKILISGKLFGAPINENLDHTQIKINSTPAISDPGVVFGYLNLEDAIEEGINCDIIEIKFNKALSAVHIQEIMLGAPATILILITEIISFKSIN